MACPSVSPAAAGAVHSRWQRWKAQCALGADTPMPQMTRTCPSCNYGRQPSRPTHRPTQTPCDGCRWRQSTPWPPAHSHSHHVFSNGLAGEVFLLRTAGALPRFGSRLEGWLHGVTLVSHGGVGAHLIRGTRGRGPAALLGWPWACGTGPAAGPEQSASVCGSSATHLGRGGTQTFVVLDGPSTGVSVLPPGLVLRHGVEDHALLALGGLQESREGCVGWGRQLLNACFCLERRAW